MTKRKLSPVQMAELPRDHCPNCGGPLKFPENWKEGLCVACGIFVEILPSTPDPTPAKEAAVPDVASRRVMAKFYLASEDLLSEPEEGEAPAEAKEEEEILPTAEPEATPAAPKLEASAPPKALPPAPTEGGEGEALPTPPSKTVRQETLSAEPQTPKETQTVPAPPPLPKQPEGPRSPAPPKPVSPRETPPEHPVSETPSRDSEDYEIVVPEPTDEKAAAVEAETVVEPEPEAPQESELVIEPGVEAELALEQAEPEYEVVEPAPVVPVAQTAVPAARTRAAAASRTATPQPRRRDRVLIHIGSVLVAFGGSGLVLGSILHDMFRIPLVGSAYNVYGPVDMSALMYGGVLLIAGLAAIALSLRGGVVKVRKAARA